MLSVALTAAFVAHGSVITPEQALARLAGSRMKAPGKGNAELLHTTLTPAGSPAVYVFGHADSDGYMLLSADDAAVPMLGYAEYGEFDTKAMPPAMKWWLDEYGRQIEFAATHGHSAPGGETAALVRSRAGREAIAPMISTHWDQVEPFNEMCPLMGTERTYTGCVATAMAQVMKYWNYPARGTGSISYTAETLQKKLTMDFSTRPFEWDKMVDDYLPGQYTDETADAVAYLMKACGYAVKMDYSTDASGALAMYIPRALTHYFGYDGNALYTLRAYHSAAEWETLIYDNLKNVGPLLYGGSSNIGGGHSFVCDGYSTDGYFHFNWGWTGMSDGYFALNALNPDALGSGGGQGGGYNFDQDALLGIRPPTGDPVVEQPIRITQMGSLTASVKDSALSISLDFQADPMWVNYNATNMNFALGAKFVPEAGGDSIVARIYSKDLRLQPGYGVSADLVKAGCNLDDLSLADGSYRVSVVTIAADQADEASAADWLDPFTFYSYTTTARLVKADGAYAIDCDPAPMLRITDAGFSTTLYYGCLQKVYLTVENETDIELSSGYAPLLATSGGDLQFVGESVSITVEPHSSYTCEWVTDLYALSNSANVYKETDYLLTFLDENTFKVLNQSYLKDVTMKPAPSAPRLALRDTPTVTDAEMSTLDEGSYIANVASITNPYEIEITMPLELTRGYCAYYIAACVCEFDEENPGVVSILTSGASPLFIDGTSINPLRPVAIEADVTATLSCPLMVAGKNYPIICTYVASNGLTPISGGGALYLTLGGASGFSDSETTNTNLRIGYDASATTAVAVSAEPVVEMQACDLYGRVVATSQCGVLNLGNCSPGPVIVSARDASGRYASLKIAR